LEKLWFSILLLVKKPDPLPSSLPELHEKRKTIVNNKIILEKCMVSNCGFQISGYLVVDYWLLMNRLPADNISFHQ